MERFDIILVSWNRLDYLKRTVASLWESGAINACERFIIVDNASTENGVAAFLDDMKKQWRAFIVQLPENKGWAAAVNSAIGLSRAPFVFMTNNDVIYQPDFYHTLFNVYHSQSGIGILGVWRHTAHGFVASGVQTATFKEMDNVPAVGWLVPKEAMEIVGMLPEHGPCDTKGGNGEDTEYVGMMKNKGFLVGIPAIVATEDKLATHPDGY